MNTLRAVLTNSSRSRALLIALAILIVSAPALCQSTSPYQVGTIMQVKVHEPTDAKEGSVKRYDISVRVGKTIYLVLFTPPEGQSIVEYKTGLDLPVSVEDKNMKFADALGRPMTVPILSQKPIDEEPRDRSEFLPTPSGPRIIR